MNREDTREARVEEILADRQDMLQLRRDQTVYKITCPICQGMGKLNMFFQCWKCRGQGMVLEKK